ncbi:MAG: hypothetical protein JOZ25_02400, partial [Actinobacteria bacterium]|nr:hypothetical protein [Actinomycetota bacterium]
MSSREAREGAVWFGSRFANGVLGFVQVSLATVAIGSHEAGRFFLFWTATWLLATVLKFGVDGILPRVVAEAQVDGRAVPSLVKPVVGGLAAFVVLLAPLLAAFQVPIRGSTVAIEVGLAACWGTTFMLSAALKAYGRIALSGIVINTLWPLGPALAPLVLIGAHSGWEDLALVTAGAGALAVIAAVVISASALGGAALRRMASLKRPLLAIEADVVGAAVLSFVYELMVWVPVVVVAVSGSTGTIAAAVFAAVRVGALVSWPYNAVVATLTPRIAAALARNDLGATRRLLTRGSLIGVAVTLPLALAVALAGRPILHVFDSAYGVAAVALALIVGGRVLDAAAGPVGEALLVGRGTWLDTLLAGSGITCALVLGLALEPSHGATAAGIAGAVAFAASNVLRLGVVGRFLRSGWRAEISLSRRAWTALAAVALVAGIGTSIALELAMPAFRRDVAFGVGAALLVAASVLGLAAARHGLRAA